MDDKPRTWCGKASRNGLIKHKHHDPNSKHCRSLEIQSSGYLLPYFNMFPFNKEVNTEETASWD